jgi:diguanylate cyclase (GGDEF)-like protein
MPDTPERPDAPPVTAESTTLVAPLRRRVPAPAAPSAANPCLVIIHGPGIGRMMPIEQATFTIGRGPRNDLVVPLGDVSRQHCRIVRGKGGGLGVVDLESTNGTYVNDVLAAPGFEVPLRAGDHLNLGGVIFKVLEGSHVESAYHEELYRTAIVDGLTQIYNRRYLSEFLEREMARAQRHGRPLALLLIDVDDFKTINDRFGHLGGDQVLREFASVVGPQMRRESCFARYGGEEFAVVLPETGAQGAQLAAERVRGIVEAHVFRVDGHEIALTVSIGIATLDTETEVPLELFRRADERLYEAKNAGRNCVAS